MEFTDILEALCQQVPEAIGAVLCDFEGETVVTALGRAAPPHDAIVRAQEHVPKAMALSMPVAEFLVRLAGAEPCALLRQFADVGVRRQAGGLRTLEMQYREVQTFACRLPEEFYVVLVTRRPALSGRARACVSRAAAALAPHLE